MHPRGSSKPYLNGPIRTERARFTVGIDVSTFLVPGLRPTGANLYQFAFKEVTCPGRGAPARAPKERADTRVCPYRGFDLSHGKAQPCHLLESALVLQDQHK